MMKRQMMTVVLTAAALGLGACGGKKAAETPAAIETETVENTAGAAETKAAETEIASVETPEETGKQSGIEKYVLFGKEDEALIEEESKKLAKSVQAVIGRKDLQALERAISYPCYLQIGDGIAVENEEEFMDLGVDEVITDELIKTVESADVDSIKLVQAGLVVAGSDGVPNIIIGRGADKTIGIVGINYQPRGKAE